MKSSVTLFTFGLLALVSGCSGGPKDKPELGEVSGTIKVDGQTKPELRVSFQPEEGRPSSGTTDDSGYYTLQYSNDEEGAKVGKGVMTISSPPPDNSDSCGGCGDDDYVDPIPPRYNINAANNPEMNKEVKPGDNTFDVEVDTSKREEVPKTNRRSSSCCCS